MRSKTRGGLGAVLTSCALLLQACGATEPEQDAVRSRDMVLEGEVRAVVDADGSRVAGTNRDDRGVLVVSLERSAVRVRDRVRVVGEQRILRVREIEALFGLDLDDIRYQPLEGEDVIVAHSIRVIPPG